MGLQLGIYATPGGNLLWDFSNRVRKLKIATNEHGYADAPCFVPMTLEEALIVVSAPGRPHVTVRDDAAGLVWEGRLEDKKLAQGGVELVAYGWWRGYSDLPYVGTHTSVTANTIANALIAFVNGVNSVMSASTALVQNPGLTLTEDYVDVLPSDILDRLVRLGDTQTPPRMWEAGVWDGRRLHFRPRGSAARTWYIDIAEPEIERSLETLFNSAYGLYEDANGKRVATATATDQASVNRHALTRREAVDASTRLNIVAVNVRDLFIREHKDAPARAKITPIAVYDAAGARWPKYAMHSGDMAVVRNIPSALSVLLDHLRSFRVLDTDYDVDSDGLEITPDFRLPSIEDLAAAGVAGGRGGGSRASQPWKNKLKNPTTPTTETSGIIVFAAGDCPSGWTEYTAAQGRVIVGVPAGGTIAGTVGSALADLGTRTISTVATHLHGVGTLDAAAEAAHTHAPGTLNNATEAAHTHGVGTYDAAAEAAHTHAANPPSTVSTATTIDHLHSVDPPSTATDSLGAHTHDVHGETTGGGAVKLSVELGGGSPFDIAGAALSAGAHTHNVNIAIFNSGFSDVLHTHSVDIASFTTGAGTSHDHALSGASGAGSTHDHAISGVTAVGSSHDHALSGSTANTGTAAVDVTMPYIQLRLCQKD
jgi:hypothetical protein